LDSLDNKCHKEKKRVAAEFVPMVLNCWSIKTIWDEETNQMKGAYKKKWESWGVRFLMGFNEPDGQHQTCTPKQAAQQWVSMQKIAKSFDPPLRLVSPSPCSGSGNSCPGGGSAFGKAPWLDSFFEECDQIDGCDPDSVEFIGMHDYEGDFDVRPDNFKARVEGFVENYPFKNGKKRQVWITEFNVGCGQTSLCRDAKNNNKKNPIYRNGENGWPMNADVSVTNEEQLGFMKKVIPYLENSKDVFRYAWFGTRFKSAFNGYPNLLPVHEGEPDVPTPLGEYYKTAPEGR